MVIKAARIKNNQLVIIRNTVTDQERHYYIGTGWRMDGYTSDTITIRNDYERMIFNEDGKCIREEEKVQTFFNESTEKWKVKGDELVTSNTPTMTEAQWDKLFTKILIIGFAIAFILAAISGDNSDKSKPAKVSPTLEQIQQEDQAIQTKAPSDIVKPIESVRSVESLKSAELEETTIENQEKANNVSKTENTISNDTPNNALNDDTFPGETNLY